MIAFLHSPAIWRGDLMGPQRDWLRARPVRASELVLTCCSSCYYPTS